MMHTLEISLKSDKALCGLQKSTDKFYKCEFCDKSFYSQSTLSRHKKLHSKSEFSEGEQPVTSVSSSETRSEVDVGKTEKAQTRFQCEHCQKCFAMKRYLKKHMQIHGKPLQCELCNKSFSLPHNLSRHKKRLHFQNRSAYTATKPYQCGQCRKCFSQQDYLEKHEQLHSVVKPFQCNHCHKRFSRSFNLCQHKELHCEKNSDARPFQCKHCHKRFSESKKLAKHEQVHCRVSANTNIFQCEYCHKCCSRKDYLMKHYKIHSGERPFKCDECPRSFIHKDQLNRHKRRHVVENGNCTPDENLAEKSFLCEFCPKMCSSYGNLQDHRRTHTKEKPFTCELCSKSYARSGALKVHMRTHTGERPFQCNYCSKSFYHSSHHKRHEKAHFFQDIKILVESTSESNQGNRKIEGDRAEKIMESELQESDCAAKSKQIRNNQDTPVKVRKLPMQSYIISRNPPFRSRVLPKIDIFRRSMCDFQLLKEERSYSKVTNSNETVSEQSAGSSPLVDMRKAREMLTQVPISVFTLNTEETCSASTVKSEACEIDETKHGENNEISDSYKSSGESKELKVFRQNRNYSFMRKKRIT